MRFIAVFETTSCNSVSEDQKCFLVAEFSVKALDEKIVFMDEHFLETNTTDVAIRSSINCIAECHVVGRHGLGDGAGSAADAKESTRYFLASANLGEGPVLGRTQIDAERLFVGRDLHLWNHTISVAAMSDRANLSQAQR